MMKANFLGVSEPFINASAARCIFSSGDDFDVAAMSSRARVSVFPGSFNGFI